MGKTVIRTDALMKPIAHFSHGMRIGHEIHLGATAGTDPNRRLVGIPPGLTDARAQADRMYRNMKLALELLGGGLGDVVRLKVYVTDWRDLGACEEAYAAHFQSGHPSRVTVGTWGFPLPHAVIEAELTAVVGRPGDQRHVVAGADDLKQALSRLANLLADSGVNASEVVKVTVTLADLRDYAAFEHLYLGLFKPPYPARTVTQAPLCEAARRVEIEAVAIAGGGKAIEPSGLHRQRGAASAAILAGDHLFVSAQPGLDEKGRVAAGADDQARAAWRRIQAILAAAGMQAGDVLRTNNWLTDWRSYTAFNEGYGEFVEPPYPPRTTVIGGILEPQSLLQIEAQAHRQGRSATVLECNA